MKLYSGWIVSKVIYGVISSNIGLCKFHRLNDLGSSNLRKRNSATVNASWLQYLLQICTRNRFLKKGKSCHALAIQFGLLTDTLTCNILINMYSKLSDIIFARQVFKNTADRSIISWNTMIAGHTHHGETAEALELFVEMHKEGAFMTEFTFSSVICACAAKSAIAESKQLHALAIKHSMDSNVFVGTAILDVYAKSHMIREARWVFENMINKSAVTWSSMVSGYVQNDLQEDALILFHQAQNLGVQRTPFTLSAVLSACASLAANIEGTQLHAVAVRTCFDSNLHVGSSLIDLYSRCGRMEDAYQIFTNMEETNIVLWNAMISGFSRHARADEVAILFEKMQQMDICPNEVTYVSLLSACSHMGLVEKGRYYFNLLRRDRHVRPNVLHYACMVDILGRAGLLSEAYDLVKELPFTATASMWGSLLSSCRIYGDTNLAKVAAMRLFKMEPNNAGNHILLSNVYAVNKRWGEVAMARNLLKESGVKKERGKSWIEVKQKVHTFVVGESNHPQIVEIYSKLDDIQQKIKKLSYQTVIQSDLHDVADDHKELLLKHHSEKLAVSFGLISMPADIPIRIYKNLRICGDCHSFFKFASIVVDREMIVRDTNRFHHFKGGFCSCADFW